MPKFFHSKYNRDTLILGVYIIGGTIAIFLIIMLANALINSSGSSHRDPVSGDAVYTDPTGGSNPDTTPILGIKALLDAGFKGDAYVQSVQLLQSFFHRAFPEHTSISYVKDSVKFEDNIYKFRVKSTKGTTFNVELSGYDYYHYTVKVLLNDDVLLDYDQSYYQQPFRNSRMLYKDLPYTFKLSDGTQGKFLSYMKNNTDDHLSYYISVNTCGDEQLRREAITEIRDFLSRNGYDPNTEFDFPVFCDGEAKHEE